MTEEKQTESSPGEKSAEIARRLRGISERRLSAAEVEAALRVPLSKEEEEGIIELIQWFRRRYPTAGERLAYARRAYARWMRSLGEGGSNR